MPPSRPARVPWTADPASVRPMLATAASDRDVLADLDHPRWIYELKYDGMRVLVSLEPGHATPAVTLRSRQGNDKTLQFPEVVRALRLFARSLRRPVLLDGELVALDARGEPLGFQHLQGRIHLTSAGEIRSLSGQVPVAFIAFDVLRDGGEDLRSLPLVDRKARLEKIFGNAGSALVRMSEMEAGSGGRLMVRAEQLRGEGLVAKDAQSIYESGRRSPAWRKIKIQCRQEFVVCGFTEPRAGRRYFGSLVLGYYAEAGAAGRLVHAGTAGSGFGDAELERVWRLLQARRQDACPFDRVPPTPEPAHWVRPELVAEVRFTEWTRDGLLRHPVYLGLRSDVDPRAVTREPGPGDGRRASPRRAEEGHRGTGAKDADAAQPRAPGPTADGGARSVVPGTRRHGGQGAEDRHAALGRRASPRRADTLDAPTLAAVVDQLSTLEDARRDGRLVLPGGESIEVTNLAKVYWPAPRLTKGDLLRFYVRISPWLCPIVADRPMVMKRYPNGVTGKAFYQQRAPDEAPAGVRVEMVDEGDEIRPRVIGGSLPTLLYMAQLAAISQDPWFSRLASPGCPDYVALDLDPMPGVPFSQVLEVARALRDELHALRVPAAAKTSGSSGLHIYVPLAPDTAYAAGQLFCQVVATTIATRLPQVATVERAVRNRGRTVYIDYLQNIEGKTLATAYSARASDFAGVSTPLAWEELDERLEPHDFTLTTVLDRFRATGNLWAPILSGPRLDLRDVLERLRSRHG